MRECAVCKTTENLQESHDVPCYLFIYSGNRQGQKNEADKQGRHLLCKKHHEFYEQELNNLLKGMAKGFATKFFRKEDDTKST